MQKNAIFVTHFKFSHEIQIIRYGIFIDVGIGGTRIESIAGAAARFRDAAACHLCDAIYVCRPDAKGIPDGVVLNVWRVCDPEPDAGR